MISLALIFESKSRTKLKAYNRSNLPKKNQSKNRTHRRRCLRAEGTCTLILVRETERHSLLSPCPRIASQIFLSPPSMTDRSSLAIVQSQFLCVPAVSVF